MFEIFFAKNMIKTRGNIPGKLEVLLLVFADRYIIRVIKQDISRL